MKKLLNFLAILGLMVMIFSGFTSSASAAGALKTSTFITTVKYGNGYYIDNDYDAALVGYAALNTKTYFNANQYGIAVTGITQSADYAWPYSVAKNGTKVFIKASHGSSETANAYGNFTVKYMKVPKLGSSITSTDYRLQTYITVTKIDKTKQAVTIKVTRQVF
ncbi:hypothetical protein [Priestia megaterium]